MEKFRKKSAIIALVLVLTIATTLATWPIVFAHDPPWEIPTYAYINVAPNPVGVNQQVGVLMQIDKIFPGATVTATDLRFKNLNLTIIKPNGAKETTIFPATSYSTSATYYYYTPDQVGTYTFIFTYPGQMFTFTGPVSDPFGNMAPSPFVNDTYLPSSATTTLTVQEEPIVSMKSTPLPTEYWTRPIYGENTDWWSISSNWLGTGSPNYDQYTMADTPIQKCSPGDAVGSQTAHIMWTKPILMGGVAGGATTSTPGDAFVMGRSSFFNPIIVGGKLYYNNGPTICVDLRTGEEIWSRTDVPALSFAYMHSLGQGPNEYGIVPILVGPGRARPGITPQSTLWQGYNPETGDWMFNASVPAGVKSMGMSKAMGPSGEYIIYTMENLGTDENPNWYLNEWNSSKLSISGVSDATKAENYNWNVSIPWHNTMSDVTYVEAYYGDMILCYEGALPGGGSAIVTILRPEDAYSWTPYTWFAVNLDPSKGALGSIRWSKTYNPPAGNLTVLEAGVDPVNRVFAEEYRETAQFVGYSMDTGEKLWGPTESLTDRSAIDYYGNQYGGTMSLHFADGKMYSGGFAGVLYCWNVTTGDLLWTYGNGGEGNSTNAGFQNIFGVYITRIFAIGNGVVYTITCEHSPVMPLYKGALARAINGTDGTEIWTLSNYATWAYAIADGYSTFFNGYDDQIYVVGRGPSATTVTASPKVSAKGSSVVIEGTVTDVSAGTKQQEQAARFPNGVPAIADEDQEDWMEYVYMQQPIPGDAIGVEVSLDAVDPNGNFIHIATVTSDMSGMFKKMWTPEVEGEYTIIATFEGSESYWPSYSETAIGVGPAAAPSGPIEPEPTEPTEAPFITTEIAILLAAVIVAIAVIFGFWILRKRK